MYQIIEPADLSGQLIYVVVQTAQYPNGALLLAPDGFSTLMNNASGRPAGSVVGFAVATTDPDKYGAVIQTKEAAQALLSSAPTNLIHIDSSGRMHAHILTFGSYSGLAGHGTSGDELRLSPDDLIVEENGNSVTHVMIESSAVDGLVAKIALDEFFSSVFSVSPLFTSEPTHWFTTNGSDAGRRSTDTVEPVITKHQTKNYRYGSAFLTFEAPNLATHLGKAPIVATDVISQGSQMGRRVLIGEATTNLLTNPSGAGGAYTSIGSPVVLQIMGMAIEPGRTSFKITGDALEGIALLCSALANVTHTCSFYASGTPFRCEVSIDGTNYYTPAVIETSPASNWTRYAYNFSAGQCNGSTSLRIRYTTGSPNDLTCWIDNVQLEAKAYATPYTDTARAAASQLQYNLYDITRRLRDVTFGCWLWHNKMSGSGTKTIFDIASPTVYTPNHISVNIASDTGIVQARWGSETYVTATTQTLTSSLLFVAFACPLSGAPKFYYNDVEATGVSVGGFDLYEDAVLFLGIEEGGTNPLNGAIAQFFAIERQLSAAEISQLRRRYT